MTQPAPPSIDRFLARLDTIDAELAAVGIDEWETAPTERAQALRRILDIGEYLGDIADSLRTRDQARRALNLAGKTG